MMRFDKIDDLTNPQVLGKLIGPIEAIKTAIFPTVGYSGSNFERIEVILNSGIRRILILKCTRLHEDWLSQRAGDRVGREASLLADSHFSAIWNSLTCPYIAFASEKGKIGLLMNDFSEHLFPDIKEPIDIKQEDLILDSIASLHASFWESSNAKSTQWLTKPYEYLQMFGPSDHKSDQHLEDSRQIRQHMREGWKIALQLLPSEIRNILTKQAKELFEPWRDLPQTILHGDLKIPNMALLPGDKPVLFDWPMVGFGPCGIDLGWYISVNTTRLARTKQEVMRWYRACLESHLQFSIEDKIWSRMTDLAIMTGTMMMLWSKALGWQSGTQRGKEEWDWWTAHLKSALSNKEYLFLFEKISENPGN